MAQAIGNLAVGAKVKLGKLYNNSLVWKIADKNHSGFPSNSVTMVTEKIIKIMASDGKEANNTDANRRSYGNNRYLHANIRQWLNKSDAAGAWYVAQHSADAPPTTANCYNYNGYDTVAGFLAQFTADEIAALVPTSLVVGMATVDGGGTETVSDKVFLLSGTEVGLTTDYTEGSKLELFTDNASRIANISADAAANSTYAVTAGAAWYWWLRTPYAAYSYVVRIVYTDGALDDYSACNGSSGLRPACNLSSSLLVSDSPDTDGAYTMIFDEPPTVPPSITVPTTPVLAGAVINVSWGASTDPEGDTITYKLERSFNSGQWTQVASTETLQFSENAQTSWNTVRYRVKAVDSHAAESGYTTSAEVIISHSTPPVISGSDRDLGVYSNSFTPTTYTVTDVSAEQVTVTETLDSSVLRIYNVTLGAVNTLGFTDEAWRKILNGTHVLRITASDGTENSVRTLTFTKAVNALRVLMQNPIAADDRPQVIIANIQGNFPAGSTLVVEACNNGFDPTPTWENITNVALNGGRAFFTNTVKTAAQWGVNIRATLNRGGATEACYITSIGGNFG